jgi:hypothetical protein
MKTDMKEPENTATASAFIRGQEYRKMNETQRGTYVVGVVDGLMFAFSLTKQTSEQRWLEECTKDMRVDQLTAAVTKYITANPDQLHVNASVLVYGALVRLNIK